MTTSAVRAVAPTTAPRPPDKPLPALLRRLLEAAAPRLADALLVRPAAETDAALLALVSRWGVLRHCRADTIEALGTMTDRALCITGSGRAVLLEQEGDTWSMSLQGDPGVGPVPDRLLAGLFPCEAWFVAQPPAARRQPDGADAAPGAVLTVALKLAAQLLGLAMPVAMLLIIDRVVTQGASDTLAALLMGLALLTGFQYLFLWLHALLAARRSELAAHPDRCQVLGAVLDCRDGARWSATAWEVLQSGADRARFAAETRPQFLADCAFVVLLAVLMAAFSPRLLAVAAAFVPLYVVVEAWGGRHARAAVERMTARRGDLSRRFLEAAAAVELIRGLDLAPQITDQWRETDAALAADRCRLTVGRRQTALAVEFLQKLSVIAIMLLGVGAVIEGAMTLGQYIAFNLLSMQLGQPVLRMAAFRRALQDHRVGAAAERRLQQHCRATRWAPAGSLALPRRACLSLRVHRVSLPSTQPARARSVSFGLLGGAWLGITGPSGCGKSTLLRTIAGIETPSQGWVRINGVDVRRLRRDSVGRRVRLVAQAPVLFSLSLAENIRLGDPAAAPARIVTVASVCGLDPLLAELPDHLNSPVGAAGRPLSGGERQRVALARALLSEPELLLLDEATAALDQPAEARLLEAVRRFLPRAAVLVVAHRPGALLGCREVLRLGGDG